MPLFDETKAGLSEKASELSFSRDTLEKVIRLSSVLGYLHSNPLTKNVLALKGGTAINLTVFNLPRLSVDIDLDYAKEVSRDEMMRERGLITNDIITYMETQRYSVSPKSRKKHSLDSLLFTYTNLGGMQDNIKIEINYSLRSHMFEPSDRTVLVNSFAKDIQVYCLQPMEIFAAKINALLSRTAVRDLYDTYNMIRFDLFDASEQDLLRKSVVFYTAVSQEEIPDTYALDRIEAITFRKIKSDLLPVIKHGEFVALEGIKKTVKEYVSTLLVLTSEEKEFLTAFKHKEYRPELLFNDKQILANIRNHPMILWKLQNPR